MQGFDVAIASIVVASVSVVVAAALAVLQIRSQNDTRQAQLFMEIYNQFYNPEFHKRWMETVYVITDENLFDSDGMPIFLKGNIGPYVEVASLCCFFEGLGLLVKKKLIDIDLVAELMSTPLILVWERIEKFVEKTRGVLGRPQVYEWYAYLYHEIQKIPTRKSQPSTQKPPTP